MERYIVREQILERSLREEYRARFFVIALMRRERSDVIVNSEGKHFSPTFLQLINKAREEERSRGEAVPTRRCCGDKQDIHSLEVAQLAPRGALPSAIR